MINLKTVKVVIKCISLLWEQEWENGNSCWQSRPGTYAYMLSSVKVLERVLVCFLATPLWYQEAQIPAAKYLFPSGALWGKALLTMSSSSRAGLWIHALQLLSYYAVAITIVLGCHTASCSVWIYTILHFFPTISMSLPWALHLPPKPICKWQFLWTHYSSVQSMMALSE